MFNSNKIILMLVILILFLTSCFSKQEVSVEDAKKDMGLIESDDKGADQVVKSEDEVASNEDSLIDDSDSSEESEEVKKQDDELFESESDEEAEGEKNSLEIDYDDDTSINFMVSEGDINDNAIRIDAKNSSEDIDKIVVEFENKSSIFPDDSHTLKKFKKGNDAFYYNAFRKYEVLDYGLNKYTFKSYIGDELQASDAIEIYVKKKSSPQPSPKGEGVATKEATIEGEDSSTNEDTNNGTSNTDNGETELSVTCSNLTEHLKEKHGWIYWNTCRPTGDDNKGIKFYVLIYSTITKEYSYEKHFYYSDGTTKEEVLTSGKDVETKDISAKYKEVKGEYE